MFEPTARQSLEVLSHFEMRMRIQELSALQQTIAGKASKAKTDSTDWWSHHQNGSYNNNSWWYSPQSSSSDWYKNQPKNKKWNDALPEGQKAFGAPAQHNPSTLERMAASPAYSHLLEKPKSTTQVKTKKGVMKEFSALTLPEVAELLKDDFDYFTTKATVEKQRLCALESNVSDEEWKIFDQIQGFAFDLVSKEEDELKGHVSPKVSSNEDLPSVEPSPLNESSIPSPAKESQSFAIGTSPSPFADWENNWRTKSCNASFAKNTIEEKDDPVSSSEKHDDTDN